MLEFAFQNDDEPQAAKILKAIGAFFNGLGNTIKDVADELKPEEPKSES